MGYNAFVHPVLFWHALSFGQNDLWRKHSSTGFCFMFSNERTALHKVKGNFIARKIQLSEITKASCPPTKVLKYKAIRTSNTGPSGAVGHVELLKNMI